MNCALTFVLLLAILAIVAVASSPIPNLRPIIGILTQPATGEVPPSYGSSYIAASYVKLVEGAGGRAVPLFHNFSQTELKHIFDSINGVIFPGGGSDLNATTPLYKSAKYLYDLALDANNRGDYFPILGICQGFQLLSIITSQNFNLLTYFDSWNLPLPLDFAPNYQSSRMLKDAGVELLTVLSTRNVTMNNHHYGVSPKDWKANANLANFYNVISTNTDRRGKTFVSTFEGKQYPIYGLQWHPEKNLYEWYAGLNIPHDFDAIRTAQYVANFFVQEARKSTHHFKSQKEELRTLIYNWKPIYTGLGGQGMNPEFEQVYAF
jgi:gamma-glutamyl hydrolase